MRVVEDSMDILPQLETEVLALCARMKELRTSERKARELEAEAARECSALKEENRAIRQALEREQGLRQEAVARIDAIVRKIQEHAVVE